MKYKQISLLLATMLLGVTPVLADEHATTVKHTGSLDGQEEYNITVPAMLTPGETGQVNLKGYWSPLTTINVTVPEEVEIKEDAMGLSKTLTVDFEDISQAGDADSEVTVTKDVTIGEITGALLGEWEGKLVYTVSVTDNTGSETHIHEWDTERTIDSEVSCTEDGQSSIHCSGCTELKDVETTPALGHNINSTGCTNCGDTIEELAGIYDENGVQLCSWSDSGIDNTCSNAANKFNSYANARSIILPKTVTSLANFAFYGCSNLEEISINSNITSIGISALRLTNLKSIIIPNSCTSIGTGAFYGCANLEYCKLPSNLNSMGNSVFMECTSLKEIEIPDGVSLNNSDHATMFKGCTSLEKAELPSNCNIVPSNMFSGCTSLKEVNLHSGITQIGNQAFYECTSFEDLEVPSSVTWIGVNAFQNVPHITYNGSYTTGSPWGALSIN